MPLSDAAASIAVHERPAEPVFAVPEPELTAREMVERAIMLRPRLRELQDETERLTRYPETIHREFLDRGFYRVLQPRRLGGYEFDVTTYYKLVVELARGCPSTGWCFALAAGHVLTVATFFSEPAQIELFGPAGDFRGPHRDIPTGTALRVDGGYVIDGVWPYCSGVPYATHALVTTYLTEQDDARPPAQRPLVMAVVPRQQLTILDDWGAILGMRGSGSNSVRIEGARIPAHFVVAEPTPGFAPATADGAGSHTVTELAIGLQIHGSGMYAGRVIPFYWGELTSVMVGTAQAALDEYERILNSAQTVFTPKTLRRNHQDYLRALGKALGMTDAAEAILLGAGERYMELCRREVEQEIPFTKADETRLVAMKQQASRLAWEAIHMLFKYAGVRFTRDGERMQRYLRDAATYEAHMGSAIDPLAAPIARTYLGDPLPPEPIL